MSQIGPYEIIEQVGAGGMATVYKAYQPKLDRFVAVKVMHQHFAQDEGFLLRFEREARIIARLDHPNIVPLYDYDPSGKQPYLVMKYIEGQTLKEVMEEGLLPLEDLRRVMRQVADALTYAHEEGVLHRDIKPSNIIIENTGQAYLTDFGLARIAQQGESTMSADSMLGTPQYISPEQAQGSADLNARTDVYSLGIILYEQVTGRVPFVGEGAYAIIHKHIYALPPTPSELNPEVPASVDRVLMKALAKDPKDRYATPNDLIKSFEDAVDASGLRKLDESRVEQAVYRGKDISEHTPGGGRYVSIPAAAPGTNPANFNEMMQTIGERFKGALNDVIQTAEEKGIVSKIASGIQYIAHEIESHVEEAEAKGEIPPKPKTATQRSARTIRMIEEDFGMEPEAVRRRVRKRMMRRRGFLVHTSVYVILMTLLVSIEPALQHGLAQLFADPGFIEDIGANYLGPLAQFNFVRVFGLLWGAGLIGHAVSLFYQSGARLEKRRRAMLGQLDAYYGQDWQQTVSGVDYRRIRRRTEERFDQRVGLITHFIAALMTTAAMFIGWPAVYSTLLESPLDVPFNLLATHNTVPAVFMLLMMFIVVLHAFGLAMGTIFGLEANENAIRREMERQRELSGIGTAYKTKNDDLYNAEKPKLGDSPRVRLTQDGEFTESFIDEIEQLEQNNYRQQK